ncbi:hypothetical protein RBSWK_01262 [Rhodopirellula baltica SWK14]|uniref:Uncharacterized protein n=1 Tax=Rhodopirellula baltica SWK14 TaxID=993516 RepID=L7CLL1_RHOBT|nr:hypothetical protein RBSWK_01262 [Rhodopirellula baltica SWK14]
MSGPGIFAGVGSRKRMTTCHCMRSIAPTDSVTDEEEHASLCSQASA